MARLKLNSVAVLSGVLLLVGAAALAWQLGSQRQAQAAANNASSSAPRVFTGAIGVQVFHNQNRLDPLAWYRSQDFRQGQPQPAQVDGYPGLQEGSSVYVSAPNYTQLPSQSCTTPPCAYVNVYLLSYGQGSDAATVEIARRLRDNWQFLHTLPAEAPDPYPGPALAREELRRDNDRLTGLGTMVQSLQQYRQQHGFYPDLAAGTYIEGHSVSTWPSWSGAYSQALGSAAPVDPVNSFDTTWPYAGPSECDSAHGFATTTCYASPGTQGGGNAGAYSCPDGSHVFEYAIRTATSTGLYANFEFKNLQWPSGLAHSTVSVGGGNSCQSYFIDLESRGASWGQAYPNS